MIRNLSAPSGGAAAALLLMAALSALCPTQALGQGVPEALASLDRANGDAWISPFTRALAPALTTGFFTTGGRGEGARLGVRMTAGIVPDGHDRFAPLLPETVVFDGVAYGDPYVVSGGDRTPSVAGVGEGAVLVPRPGSDFEAALDAAGVSPDRRAVRLPGGLDLPRAPLPLVEVSLALRGLGLQLVGRFTPTVRLFDEIGDVSAFGGGALITVSRFLPFHVVDIGLSAVTQKLDAADWLDASASAFGLVVSRDFGPLRPYVHGTVGSATTDVRWTVENPDGIPLLPPDGSRLAVRRSSGSEARFAVGATIDAGPLGVSAEYSPGRRDVLSVRLAFPGR